MKKFFVKALILCAPAILFTAVYCSLCWYTDIYNVFHWQNMRFTAAEPNNNYIKTKLVLKNPRAHNAFMFGNSRVGFIPVEFLEQSTDSVAAILGTERTDEAEAAHATGENTGTARTEATDLGIAHGADKNTAVAHVKAEAPHAAATVTDSANQASVTPLSWFNMAYSMGVPSEYLQTLQTFVQNGVPVRRIYVGIDNNTCAIDPATHLDDLKRRPYQVFAADPIKLLDYFFCFDKSQFYKIRALDAAANAHEQRNYYAHGGERYTQELGESGKNFVPDGYEGYVYQNAVADIRALKDFCREHDIEATFFVAPLWHQTYRNACGSGYLEFLAACAEVTDFVSFAGVFDCTKDSANFYEASHFRTNIGRAVAEVLASRPDKTPQPQQNEVQDEASRFALAVRFAHPADALWGMRINVQNKDEYIELLHKNLATDDF